MTPVLASCHPYAPTLPVARGHFTDELFARLRRPPRRFALDLPDDDEDAALALYVMYELHYQGFANVDDAWEWEPALLELRRELEHRFERALRDAVGAVRRGTEVVVELHDLARKSGPSLSQWCAEHASLRQMREFAIHRSAYQLKEADPHTWAVPRLRGRAKSALVEIQADEYGGGRPDAMHSELFAGTMDALGLDSRYGAYLDLIPAVTLNTVNLISMFGLHRRWRGALIGHLTLFELSSAVPMSRYAATLRRLGIQTATAFYDAHVEADVAHASTALHDMAGALARDEPELADDIVFGARALDAVESAFASHLLTAWDAGHSSLRPC
jgi:hypothetical protein